MIQMEKIGGYFFAVAHIVGVLRWNKGYEILLAVADGDGGCVCYRFQTGDGGYADAKALYERVEKSGGQM